MIPLSEQIEEVERELALREAVLSTPKHQGKTVAVQLAQFYTPRLRAVLRTLQWLQINETEIREIMAHRWQERERRRLEIQG